MSCQHCGGRLVNVRPNAAYCSAACRAAAYRQRRLGPSEAFWTGYAALRRVRTAGKR